MSEHKINIEWKRDTADFAYETYDRTFKLSFDGGQSVKGSSATSYFGKAEHANPEELLAAAVSSCHMLTFLAIAAKSRFVVDEYNDSSVAVLDKNEKGLMAVTKIYLRPKIVFGGDTKPDADRLTKMHASAHRNCMIANSVLSEVILEPI